MIQRFTIAACAALLVASAAHAQDEDVLRPSGRLATGRTSASPSSGSSRWAIGVEGGVNASFFGQTVNGPLETSIFRVNESGFGIAPFASLFVDYSITDRIGVQLKAAYDGKAFGRTHKAVVDCTLRDALGNAIGVVATDMEAEYSSTIAYATITPLFRWEPLDRFVVLIGPTFQFRASALTTTSTVSVADTSLCLFNPGTPDESRTISSEESLDSTLANLRVGIDVSIGYRFWLSPTVSLVPRIGYQYIFTRPLENDVAGIDQSRLGTDQARPYTITDPTLHSLQAVLGLWINL